VFVKLIHGNSRSMDEVEDESVHLAVTSPPYINAIDYNRNNPDNIGNYDGKAYYEMIYDVYSEVFRALKPGRRFVLNVQDIPGKDEVAFVEPVGFKNMLIAQKIGFVLSYIGIWDKGRNRAAGSPMGTIPYPASPVILGNFEYLFFFRKPGHADYSHVMPDAKERCKLSTEEIASMIYSVWSIRPETDREHPAPFPEEIPRRAIKLFSFEGETVLEPFCGSGTTMKVSRDLKRSCIGYELELKYCKMIKSRLAWGLQFIDGTESYKYEFVGQSDEPRAVEQVTL
jgi:DNA modification methylase